MTAELRRRLRAYLGISAMSPKLLTAYSIWFWMEFFVQILTMAIFTYFWRAVYAQGQEINGLVLQQTLNYILLAQVCLPLIENQLLLEVGHNITSGQIIMELLRPLDYQGVQYISSLTLAMTNLVTKIPLLIIAWFAFGLQLPTDTATWGAFLLSLFLGHAVLFCFDWILSCLAFYTTEVWGLHMARTGIGLFFSGALIPLDIMPPTIQKVVNALPFSQALYSPVSLLSGITPVAEASQVWLTQLIWLTCLFIAARAIFSRAVRKVTVQGG
ncbi:MAG: ABC-2 family transporter protein [Anaerolineae bacterium]|nr:ABC-2 family transporter protein [Anaerolineae bacterium]